MRLRQRALGGEGVQRGGLGGLIDAEQLVLQLLGQAGQQIARRTIAKYRDQLDILPSHLRKSYQ